MSNKILYHYQFGFRKSHSTTLALIDVTDNLLFDDNISVGIYIDLQKAFDTVNHKILLAKMYNYGIRGIVHNWFSSYLTDKKQYTVVGNNQSLLSGIWGILHNCGLRCWGGSHAIPWAGPGVQSRGCTVWCRMVGRSILTP